MIMGPVHGTSVQLRPPLALWRAIASEARYLAAERVPWVFLRLARALQNGPDRK